MGDVGERFVMDLDACELFPEAEFRGRAERGTPERVLFEYWSSVANLVR